VTDLDLAVLDVLLTNERRRYWGPGAVWYAVNPQKLCYPKEEYKAVERSLRDLSLIFPFVKNKTDRDGLYYVDMAVLFDMWQKAILPPPPPTPDEDYVAMLQAAGMI
jgi:hypothetical protein